MPSVRIRAAGRSVLVTKPAGPARGHVSVTWLSLLARARSEGAAACLLPPAGGGPEALLALSPGDVSSVEPRSVVGRWLDVRWQLAMAAGLVARAPGDARASVASELARELRRKIANRELPSRLRERLRHLAQRPKGLDDARAHHRCPRRWLREGMRMSLPAALRERARAASRRVGLDPDVPCVLLDLWHREDAADEAVRYLRGAGYVPVNVSSRNNAPEPRGATVLHAAGVDRPLLEVSLLLSASFVVTESQEWQDMACLTGTPSLRLNAEDPYDAYPAQATGLFTLRVPVDLDSGRTLTLDDRLREEDVREARGYGWRDAPPSDVVEALVEMHDGVQAGWYDRPSQTRFRARLADASERLGRAMGEDASRSPEDGFVGAGRLAAFQADRGH